MRPGEPETWPPTTPNAFENVPISTWTSSWLESRKWETIPRPSFPEDALPVGVVDVDHRAVLAPQGRRYWSSGAMSPSIEKTPSVMIRIRR